MSEYKSGYVTVEGHTFLLEFWKNDSYFGLPFVSASEIVTEKRKPHWWSRETRSVETKWEIDSGWTH